MNTVEYTYLCMVESLVYMYNSVISGSSCRTIYIFLRNPKTDFQRCHFSFHSQQQWRIVFQGSMCYVQSFWSQSGLFYISLLAKDYDTGHRETPLLLIRIFYLLPFLGREHCNAVQKEYKDTSEVILCLNVQSTISGFR